MLIFGYLVNVTKTNLGPKRAEKQYYCRFCNAVYFHRSWPFKGYQIYLC